MRLCEIYHVTSNGSFVWKWRHQLLDGSVVVSKNEYALYYECVSAALKKGYQPNIKCFSPGDRAARHTHT